MAKRDLEFEHFDQVSADVRSLLEQGYESHGKWNLAQSCKHMNCWMGYPMDGYPDPGLFMKPMLWVMKVTMGKKQFKKILASGGFKDGLPTMPKTVFEADSSSDREAVEEFLQTIERFKAHSGPVAASPLFGEMDNPSCKKLQLIHCQHHLAFLTPKQ